MNGINCPHCIGHTKSIISCQCCLEKDKFHGDTSLHIGNYCNMKYTQCKQYSNVRRWLNLEKSDFVQRATKDMSNFRRKADIDFIKYSGAVAWKLKTIKKSYEDRRERV